MKNRINLYLLEYAINSILRQKSKNFFIFFIFVFLVFLLSSVFLVTNSLRYELDITLDSLPQITVQKLKAGKSIDVDTDMLDAILDIDGVSDANTRLWGYYYFANAGVNFSIVGLNQYENQYKKSFQNIVEKFDLDGNKTSMVVGCGVKKILDKNYYKKYFNFIKPDGTLKRVYLGGVFCGDSELESNDVVVVSDDTFRDIFDIASNKATDIVVKVSNTKEIPTIVSKIKLLYPDCRVITTDDFKISYQNIFDYKSGVFLGIFVIAIFTFFMIVYEKASGLSSEEKREIGILKAVGWRVDDVLKERFYESFIISFFAYITGVGLSFYFVYILHAPLLQNIFVGYSQLKTTFALPFVFDFMTLSLIFFLSVPVYIGATLIPAWRVATLEADEVIR